MVGAFAVGKTSLVRRFVHNIYDEKYLTTIGVKIDRRVVDLDEVAVNLILWDLAGEDAFEELKLDYVRGSSGLILVADGTRPDTLGVARALRTRTREAFGELPAVLALNKVDLTDGWRLDDEDLDFAHQSRQWQVFRTSALTGASVEKMIWRLARDMVGL